MVSFFSDKLIYISGGNFTYFVEFYLIVNICVEEVFMGCLAAILRFDITLTITPLSIAIILIAQITMICIGFAIAYLLPPNAMALATQLIMIGGLLFSPITYPMDRLPEWTTYIHQYLPFVPTTDLLRSTLFNLETFSEVDLFVIIIWAIAGFIVSLITLSRRE